MNIIKQIILSVLLLGISIISQGQEVKIDWAYHNQDNLLVLNLNNKTDQEIIIMNQSFLNEFSGSFISITQNVEKKQTYARVPLFNMEKGKRILVKPLKPKESITVSYYFDMMGVSNVSKTELQLVVFIKDEKTEKLTTKIFCSEFTIK